MLKITITVNCIFHFCVKLKPGMAPFSSIDRYPAFDRKTGQPINNPSYRLMIFTPRRVYESPLPLVGSTV